MTKPKVKGLKAKPIQKELTITQLKKIRDRGLVISGSIGCGKSELAKEVVEGLTRFAKRFDKAQLDIWDLEEQLKHLKGNPSKIEDIEKIIEEVKGKIEKQIEKLREFKDVRIRVFDIIFNWSRNFRKGFSFQTVDSKTQKIGLKRKILYNLDFETIEERAETIKKIIRYEYVKNKDRFREDSNAFVTEWYIYVIEESNVILSTKTVKGFWLDFVSTARNFGQIGIYIMQRMADSSTKAIERCPNFCFGQTSGQNDMRKIKGMIDKEKWKELREFGFLPNQLGEHEFLVKLGNEIFKLDRTDIENKDKYKGKKGIPILESEIEV